MCLKIRCDGESEFLELNKALAKFVFVGRTIEMIAWPCLVRKNFQDFPSHRIFVRMHRALNIDENKN